MDGKQSKENIAALLKDTNTTTATSYDFLYPRRHTTQKFLLIWLDARIDQSNEDCQNTLEQLRNVVNNVNIFKQPDECVDFLTEIDEIKVFLIIEGILAQQMVPLIHDISQLDSFYIFCNNKSRHEQWTKEWIKVKGIYTDTTIICEALKLEVKQCNQNSIALSFITMGEEVSDQSLDQLEPSFMYTQILKEILLQIEYNEQSIKNFATYCRNGDYGAPNNINRFENEYHNKSPIWWYTLSSFIFSILNNALRMLKTDTIINMGFFIRDLHYQIKQIHTQQVNSYNGQPFVVYRGQCLSKIDFEKLLKSTGGLISFNNFLSTSMNLEVSLGYAEGALTKDDTVGILFKMTIDPSISSAPFASIREFSYFNTEEETLFSMHTVFRVVQITPIDNKSSLYQVDLKLTADDDQELRILTEHIRDETAGETGWQQLARLLLKIGQFDKAEELYIVFLDQAANEAEKAIYYNQLGYVKYSESDYEKAIYYYEKALQIYQNLLHPDHSHLAISYNNIGLVYDKMGEHTKALSYLEKALELRDTTHLPNRSVSATFYGNMGRVYKNMGDSLKALSFYEKDLEIQQKTLPPNHPSLAQSYNNIASMYYNMGEYFKTTPFYEKALAIQLKSLPPYHPDLAASYNNIGLVYDKTGNYSKAISCLEKAREIRQKALPPSHPSLATVYGNIGAVYNNMGEYSKALSFYEQDLRILEKALPTDYFSLAQSYNNIASMYDNKGEYSIALPFYNKALEIYQQTLHSDHPNLATSFNNIGSIYNKMGEYSNALTFLEKSIEVQQKTLHSNHPSLATSYGIIGGVFNNMGEYSTAFSFYKKHFEILKKILPKDHPTLATSYNNIASMHYNVEEYLTALPLYEKALKIRQKTLHLNHPLLATSYNNIGVLYSKMEEYTKALSFLEKALEIQEKTLPPILSDLATSYNNIGLVYDNMREYEKAISFYERALDIWQRSLAPSHVCLTDVRKSIELVKMKL